MDGWEPTRRGGVMDRGDNLTSPAEKRPSLLANILGILFVSAAVLFTVLVLVVFFETVL